MSNEMNRYNNYLGKLLPNGDLFNFADKERNVRDQIFYMLNRTKSMFKWKGLPDTIPERIVELYLQINGNLCFTKIDDELYVFTGGLGGEPDVYYRPTKYVIANPALKISKTLTINEDCVVVSNDTLYMGLIPLFKRYATLLAENELSMNLASINSRIIAVLSAMDEDTRISAEEYLKQVRDGKQGVIAENTFLDGIKVQPIASTSNSNFMTNLIEFEQYCKASLFNEIGLNANYNMKRESLNSSESQLNNDALLPLVDDMLNCRKTGAEKINEMFGTNITVDFASSWEDNEIEIKQEHGETAAEGQIETEEKGVAEDEKNPE